VTISPPVSVVVTDTSLLINLSHTDHLDLLGQLRGFRFVIPDEVISEVTQPEQASLVEDALLRGVIFRETTAAPEELEIFGELSRILGKGESACLALAQSRGWIVACDERRVFFREAESRLGPGRILNTPGVYLLCIRAGLLTVEEADAAKRTLEHHRFRMAFVSFHDFA
jgi:predicted nucleic acid-binding protein